MARVPRSKVLVLDSPIVLDLGVGFAEGVWFGYLLWGVKLELDEVGLSRCAELSRSCE